MLDIFTLIIILTCLIALLIGSYTDLKTREVPDWLNFSLIAAGLGIRSIVSIVRWDYHPILYGLIGLAIFVAIAFIMFYAGQWGGGDAKMLMGLGALLGFDFRFDGLFVSFFLAIIFIGAFYGLFWSFSLIIINWKAFKKSVHSYMHKKPFIYYRIATLTLATIIIIAIVFLKDPAVRLTLISAILLIYIVMYLYVIFKAIEDVCMIKKINVSKLTEGDWINEPVKHKGKLIAGPKDLGITKEQIAKLKQLHIKEVVVKEGIPFVPSFLLAFLFALMYGNILIVLTGLI